MKKTTNVKHLVPEPVLEMARFLQSPRTNPTERNFIVDRMKAVRDYIDDELVKNNERELKAWSNAFKKDKK